MFLIPNANQTRGTLKEMLVFRRTMLTCIWDAWRSMVMMWSAPDTDNMLATSFAEMGARLWRKGQNWLSLSWLAQSMWIIQLIGGSSESWTELKRLFPNIYTYVTCWVMREYKFTSFPHPHLVLLVLSRVWETGDDCSHSRGRGYLTRIYHDEKLHQVIVDLTTTTLNNVDILSSDTLSNLNTAIK